jgi:hypothetical protein
MDKSFPRAERGVAVIVMLFALSIFSVLSLTVLRNSPLESVLRTSDSPDLHVVLYTGGAGSPEIVGRLNIPTVWREQEGIPDQSDEIRAPGPVGSSITTELEPGLAYAVQLTQGLRVCCDSGDGACSKMTWDQQVPEGSLSPAMEKSLATRETNRQLHFSLSSADVADNLILGPNAVIESPFLIRAARVPEGAQLPIVDSAAVSCRLVTPDAQLASGTLQLQPGVDSQHRVNRISAGSVELSYRATAK